MHGLGTGSNWLFLEIPKRWCSTPPVEKGFEADGSLDQHDLRVTGIDWAPKTNRIVTSGVFPHSSLFLTGTGAGMGPLGELTHALKHI